jgi:hypothetical protein
VIPFDSAEFPPRRAGPIASVLVCAVVLADMAVWMVWEAV